jgi:hypothetical protein
MKYYLYISNTKVDMLYPQIPSRLRENLATELKIDFKVLSTTFSEEPPEETTISKLKVVTEYIEKNEPVGTVDEPKSYFKGTLPMKWGPYGENNEIVYFAGSTSNTVFGLGGSMDHVIGSKGESSAQYWAASTTPYLISTLKNELNLLEPDLELRSLMGYESPRPPAMRAVYQVTTKMEGPVEQLQFLAKKLLDTDDFTEEEKEHSNRMHWEVDKRILLGTPLYVAMAD